MANNESGSLKMKLNQKEDIISDKEQFFSILENNTLQMPKHRRFLKKFKMEALYKDLTTKDIFKIIEINETTKNFKVLDYSKKIL